jgi:predicted permease
VFALIALGFLYVKVKLVPESTAEGLAKFVFFAAVPALFFRAVTKGDMLNDADWRIIAAYFGSCFVLYFLAQIFSKTIFKLSPVERPLFSMGCTYSNTILLGIPIILSTFGEAAKAPMFFILSVHTFTLMPVVVGMLEVAKGSEREHTSVSKFVGHIFLKILANPIILAMIAGVLWLSTGIPVPDAVDTFLSFLGLATIPCSLFAVGASLASHRLGGNMSHSLSTVVFKLFLHPALAWFFAAKIAGLPPISVGVVTLMAAMPSGVNVFVIAQQYGVYVQRAASAVLVSTVLSVITLSFLITWLKF